MKLQKSLDITKLVFVDESGAKTNMTRLYGRSLHGARAFDDTPHGHWCTTTMLSSIRLEGTCECMAIEGSTDREIFREYVRAVLVPSLRPGDVVILDNLGTHCDAEARSLIEGAQATLMFLPPYSPDLNPIEQLWSKVKTFLRGTKTRTEEGLHEAIGAALKTVTAEDAINWFCCAGYAASQH